MGTLASLPPEARWRGAHSSESTADTPGNLKVTPCKSWAYSRLPFDRSWVCLSFLHRVLGVPGLPPPALRMTWAFPSLGLGRTLASFTRRTEASFIRSCPCQSLLQQPLALPGLPSLGLWLTYASFTWY